MAEEDLKSRVTFKPGVGFVPLEVSDNERELMRERLVHLHVYNLTVITFPELGLEATT